MTDAGTVESNAKPDREASCVPELGERLLDADEVAAHLGVNRSTVYRMAGQASGIPVVEMKGSLRFRPADVREYVQRCLVAGRTTSKAQRLIAAQQVAEPQPRSCSATAAPRGARGPRRR
jgi:excisionase family DNA binding protein